MTVPGDQEACLTDGEFGVGGRCQAFRFILVRICSSLNSKSMNNVVVEPGRWRHVLAPPTTRTSADLLMRERLKSSRIVGNEVIFLRAVRVLKPGLTF